MKKINRGIASFTAILFILTSLQPLGRANEPVQNESVVTPEIPFDPNSFRVEVPKTQATSPIEYLGMPLQSSIQELTLQDIKNSARQLFRDTLSRVNEYQEKIRGEWESAGDDFNAVYNAGAPVRNLYRSGQNITNDIKELIESAPDLDLSQYSENADELLSQLEAYYLYQINLQEEAKAERDFWKDALKKNPEQMAILRDLKNQILEATDIEQAKELYAQMELRASGLPIRFGYSSPVTPVPNSTDEPVALMQVIVNGLKTLRSEVNKKVGERQTWTLSNGNQLIHNHQRGYVQDPPGNDTQKRHYTDLGFVVTEKTVCSANGYCEGFGFPQSDIPLESGFEWIGSYHLQRDTPDGDTVEMRISIYGKSS